MNLDAKADTILIDGDKMAQVFINLLLNSCESMERNGTVEVTSKQDETHVEIAIKDDGPGIGEEEREKIFTAFYYQNDLNYLWQILFLFLQLYSLVS